LHQTNRPLGLKGSQESRSSGFRGFLK